jgi:hypothetical protein
VGVAAGLHAPPRAFPFLDTYFKDYIEKTFGGPDKAFAPGVGRAPPELEAL